jgi:DNA-directed RNA polymerase subunit RPC12/RpoP
LLKAAGVACYLKDEYTVTLDPLLSPAIGGMKLLVDASQLDLAIGILEKVAADYLQTLPCPECGAKDLQKIIKRTAAAGFWQKIRNLLVEGGHEKIHTYYRCLQCGYVLDQWQLVP